MKLSNGKSSGIVNMLITFGVAIVRGLGLKKEKDLLTQLRGMDALTEADETLDSATLEKATLLAEVGDRCVSRVNSQQRVSSTVLLINCLVLCANVACYYGYESGCEAVSILQTVIQ